MLYWFNLNYLGYAFQVRGYKPLNIDEMLSYINVRDYINDIDKKNVLRSDSNM